MSECESRDPRAWMRAVVDTYENPLARYATHLMGDVDAAGDVVQETFLRFCTNGAPREDSRVAPWLFTVCRNLALDQRRRRKPMISLAANDANTQTDDRPTPAAVAEDGDIARQALAVLAELPERQQEALRLRLQHDLSYREIGEIMKTSVGNVGYLLHHAIAALRKRVETDLPTRAAAPRSSL